MSYKGFCKRSHEEKVEKVLACHGHLTYRSIAEVVGVDYNFVTKIMYNHGRRAVRKSYSLTHLTVE